MIQNKLNSASHTVSCYICIYQISLLCDHIEYISLSDNTDVAIRTFD